MSHSQQPLAQLESLKYRTTQIMESIMALQYLIDANGQPIMPSWPDILARYNLLLSQTHSLSVSLSSALAQQSQSQLHQPPGILSGQNPFQRLALHPIIAIPEQQLDHALAPLLRNQPTVQVVKEEDIFVRRLAAVLKTEVPDGPERYEQVTQECVDIRRAHDARVGRAIKAVTLLRDRYEWRVRVEAEDISKEQDDSEEDREGAIIVGGDGVEERRKEEDGGGDVMMNMRYGSVAVEEKPPMSAGSSLASETEEANEIRETEDVLGQGTTPV